MDMDIEIKSDNTEEEQELNEVEQQTTTESNVSDEKEVDTSEVISADEDLDTLEKTLTAQKEKLLHPEVKEEVKKEDDFEDDVIKPKDVEDKTEQEEAGKTDPKPLNKHVVKINKDYIYSQPEEHREILQSILGKKEYALSDEGLLKNYINSQIKIKDDATRLEQLKTEKKVPEFSTEDLDQVTKLTNKAVEAELRAKYPDMPDITDVEAMKDWRAYMNSEDPETYYQYREDRERLSKEYKSEAENEVHLRKNADKIAQLQTEKEFGEFQSYVKAKGLSLEEIGFDNTDNKMVRSILYKNGKPNLDVVAYYNNEPDIPIIMNGRVLGALKDQFLDTIIEQRELKARQSTFEKREALKPNPSLSGGPAAGKTNVNDRPKVKDRVIDPEEDYDLLEETLKLQNESFKTGTSIS